MLVPKTQMFKVHLGRWRPGAEGEDRFPKVDVLLKAPFYNDDCVKRVREMLQSAPLKVDLHSEADHMSIESSNGDSRISTFRRDSSMPSNLEDLPFHSVYCYKFI